MDYETFLTKSRACQFPTDLDDVITKYINKENAANSETYSASEKDSSAHHSTSRIIPISKFRRGCLDKNPLQLKVLRWNVDLDSLTFIVLKKMFDGDRDQLDVLMETQIQLLDHFRSVLRGLLPSRLLTEPAFFQPIFIMFVQQLLEALGKKETVTCTHANHINLMKPMKVSAPMKGVVTRNLSGKTDVMMFQYSRSFMTLRRL